jgi:hypothetical protein
LQNLLLHDLLLDLGLVVNELLMVYLEAVKDTYVIDEAHPTLPIGTSLNPYLSFLEFFELLNFTSTHL